MDAHIELWLWQSGRNSEHIGTSEPPLWLAAEALSQSLKGGGAMSGAIHSPPPCSGDFAAARFATAYLSGEVTRLDRS